MNRSLLASIVIAATVAGAGAGYWYATSRSAHDPSPQAATGETEPGRRVLYWYDPMVPQSRFDKPGKSPFMDMQLVPKYADEAAGEGTVAIDPRVLQNLGVRTAEARPGALEMKLSAVGNVEYNERSVVLVQPRVGGFVEKLHVRAALDPVREGDPLVEILFPDWAAAQEEFLLLRRRSDPASRELAEAARQRLALVGMSEEHSIGVETVIGKEC